MANLHSNIQLKKQKKYAVPRAWHGAPGLAWSHTSGWYGGGDHARPRLITWGLAGPKWGGPAWYTHVGGGSDHAGPLTML